MRENYNENKKEILDNRKLSRITNRDNVLEKESIRRNNNRERLRKEYKMHYDLHRDTILEKNKVIVSCQCGCNYTRNNKSRHEKSLKHQTYLGEIE